MRAFQISQIQLCKNQQTSMATQRREKFCQISRYFPLNSVDAVVELFREEIFQTGKLGQEREPDLALLSIVLGAVENALTASTPTGPECPPVEPSPPPPQQQHRPPSKRNNPASPPVCVPGTFPPIKASMIEAFYEKFTELLRLDPSSTHEVTPGGSDSTTIEAQAHRARNGGDEGSRKKYAPTSRKRGRVKPEVTEESEPGNDRRSVTSRVMVKKVSDVIWSSLCSSYYKDRAHIQSLYSLLAGKLLLYKHTCTMYTVFSVAASVVVFLKF